MSIAEDTLYCHLTSTESLDYLIRQGFLREDVQEVIPSELGRKLVVWCIEQYSATGRIVAPSKDAIMATWGDQLIPQEIEINDDVELDSIKWTVDQLKTDFVQYQAGEFAKAITTEVTQADGPDKVKVLLEYSQILHTITASVVDRKNQQIASEGIEDSLKRYEIVATEGHQFKGMTFGLPVITDDVISIDQHIMGLHPGELCVLAGTSGGGKSWFTLAPLISEFKRGRKSVLYTIENDLEMTYDRLACMYCRVPYDKYQRGECSDPEIERIREIKDQFANSDHQPLIVHPSRQEATGANMIRQAISEGADSVIIDQLSHIQPVAKSRERDRNRVVAEIVQDLNFLISEGADKIPLLLMHQINRKGREEARKVGRYLMDHLGEATQVENEADFVFAIYQSQAHVLEERAEFQTLKSRRVMPKDWEIEWRPYVGDYRIRREING